MFTIVNLAFDKLMSNIGDMVYILFIYTILNTDFNIVIINLYDWFVN